MSEWGLYPIYIDLYCTQCYNRGHKCVHGAMKHWTVSSESLDVSVLFYVFFLALLWAFFFRLFFAHFRVPLVNHLDHIEVERGMKGLMPLVACLH